MLSSVLTELAINLEGASVLEVGASPTHGLAIALALLGAAKVISNNIAEVDRDISFAYAKNIAVLTSLMAAPNRRFSELIERDGERVKLSDSIFEILGSTDAAALPEHIKDVDLIFSFSVLEHMRRLPEVLQRLRRAISPTGVTIHWIDLRDHTDFNDPLKYLRLSESEFLSKYSEDHNRWRASEYLRMFDDAGWKIIRKRYAGQPETLNTSQTDMIAIVLDGPERFFRYDSKSLIKEHHHDYFSGLSPLYRALSPDELSVMVLEVVATPA
jgi:SAM-dependent methyltransferase